MVVYGTALAVLPTQHQKVIPIAFADKVSCIMLIGKLNMLTQLQAVSFQLRQLTNEALKLDSVFQSIEVSEQFIEGFCHVNLRFFRRLLSARQDSAFTVKKKSLLFNREDAATDRISRIPIRDEVTPCSPAK